MSQRSSVSEISPSKAPRVLRVHCTTHCRACGTHFSSTGAFDRHRQFEEGHKGDWDHRICAEPADDDWFGVKTTNGVCDIVAPSDPEYGVTVWTDARGLDTNPWRKAA